MKKTCLYLLFIAVLFPLNGFSRTIDTVMKELTPYLSILTTCGFRPEWDEKSKSITGKEYHVSVKGSDSNTGSASKPFKTISAAVRCAYPGDTITVHSGTYREWINPVRGGESDSEKNCLQGSPRRKG